jgi:hypothetical protein
VEDLQVSAAGVGSQMPDHRFRATDTQKAFNREGREEQPRRTQRKSEIAASTNGEYKMYFFES